MAIAFRLSGILELSTAQFEARMAAAGQALERFSSNTHSARQGMQLLRSGVQALAFEGFGAMPGPLARVTSGLGALAIGSGPLLAVLAGLGAISLAFRTLGQDTAEAAKAQEDFLNQLAKLGPRQQLQAQLFAAQASRAALGAAAQPPSSMGFTGAFQYFTRPSPGSQKLTDAITALDTRIADLTKQLEALDATERTRVAVARGEIQPFFGVSEARARLGLTPATFPTFGPQAPTQTLQDFKFGRFFRAGIPGTEDVAMRQRAVQLAQSLASTTTRVAEAQQLLDVALQQGWITAQQRAEAEATLEAQMRRSTKGANQLQLALAAAIGSAILAIAGARTPAGVAGGFLSGAGGILTTLGASHPALALPGAILSGIGGIFGLFDHEEDRRAAEAEANAQRRHRELLQAMADSEPVIVPVRSGAFTDPREMDELVAAIQDARARRVLPGGVG